MTIRVSKSLCYNKEMKNINIYLTVLIPLLSFSSPWKKGSYNDPKYFKVKEYRYDKLIKKGETPRIPVASVHWLDSKGGTSWRYQTNESHYKILNGLDQIKKIKQLEALSPSEKYDIVTGNYDFPLTKQERVNLNTHRYDWTGYCHGWTVGSHKYQFPRSPITITNKDGIKVKFWPQDIVALVSYFEGMFQTNWDYTLGMYKIPSVLLRKFDKEKTKNYIDQLLSVMHEDKHRQALKKILKSKNTNEKKIEDMENYVRKSFPSKFYSPYFGVRNRDPKKLEDNDLNPGALHLILTNYLGAPNPKDRKGLVADTDPLKPVWNRPIFGYEYKELKRTNNSVDVEMNVKYIKELDVPKTGEINSVESIRTKNMKYTLDLDKDGKITGGKWYPNSDRFDFFWTGAISKFKGFKDQKFYDHEVFKQLLSLE